MKRTPDYKLCDPIGAFFPRACPRLTALDPLSKNKKHLPNPLRSRARRSRRQNKRRPRCGRAPCSPPARSHARRIARPPCTAGRACAKNSCAPPAATCFPGIVRDFPGKRPGRGGHKSCFTRLLGPLHRKKVSTIATLFLVKHFDQQPAATFSLRTTFGASIGASFHLGAAAASRRVR